MSVSVQPYALFTLHPLALLYRTHTHTLLPTVFRGTSFISFMPSGYIVSPSYMATRLAARCTAASGINLKWQQPFHIARAAREWTIVRANEKKTLQNTAARCSVCSITIPVFQLLHAALRFIRSPSLFLSAPFCRIIDFDTGVGGEAVPVGQHRYGTVAVQRRQRHLGTVPLHARDVHRLVPVRAEVLQGQAGKRTAEQRGQLPVRDQNVSQVPPVHVLRAREAAVFVGRMTENGPSVPSAATFSSGSGSGSSGNDNSIRYIRTSV